MGLGLGYLLNQMRDRTSLPMKPATILATWLAAFLVGTLVIYGLIPYQKGYDLVASVWERAIYGASTASPGPSPSPGSSSPASRAPAGPPMPSSPGRRGFPWLG